MADKYLRVQSGFQQEKEFVVVSSGALSDGCGVGLDGSGLLDPSVLPSGLDGSLSLAAETTIATGDILHVNTTGGYVLASATAVATEKPRYGNAVARVSAASGDLVPGILPGGIAPTGVAVGVGENLFLRAGGGTAGNVVAPDVGAVGSGGIVQRVGRSYAATSFIFEPGEPVILTG